MTFDTLGLAEPLLRAVNALGFEQATPIQELVLSAFRQHDRDLVALAQTGTGKTAAFGLSILGELNTTERMTQALVLTPTRELCNQVATELTSYSQFITGLKIATIYGGASISKQERELSAKPHIIVATPGRLVDMIERGAADLASIRYVILDEADEMLNMGFKEDLNRILAQTPQERRTLLFSATMPAEVSAIAKRYMRDALELTAGVKNSGSENVSHEYYVAHAKDRYTVLRRIIDVNPDMYAIIFCRTRQDTHEVATKLIKDGYNADALHGDMTQNLRDQVMDRFRIKNLKLLIATDVAARGIDVNSLTHVINFSLPENSEIYNHRSGRTGRAGNTGVSITIVNMHERHKIFSIEKSIRKKFEAKRIPSGEDIWKQQLLSHVDKIFAVELDQEHLGPILSTLHSKLETLDREELINRFVMLEFTRLFAHYKDAQDLNVSFRSEERSSRGDRYERSDRSDRFSSDRRSSERRFSRDRDDSRGDSRGSRYGEKDRDRSSSERGERRSEGKTRSRGMRGTRFVMNIGAMQKMKPARLLGMINDAVGHNKIDVEDISIESSQSFFTVSPANADEVKAAFQNNFGKVRVRALEAKSTSRD